MGVEVLPPLPGCAESEKFVLTSTVHRRFAILLAGHASEYIRNTYGGVASLFKSMLSDSGEIWDTYHVVDGSFPSEDDLHRYEGFIITGSFADAHGSEPWVLRLCEVIQRAYTMKRKLLGICFGHQVMCRALGGKSGRAAHGWELGLKKVVLADAMHSKPYALNLPPSLSILEIHQDEVYEVPIGGEVLASSAKTGIEMFAMGNQVLGIQGHPEFEEDITLDILDGYSRKNRVPEEVINRAKLSLREAKADHEILKQMCKSFLKAPPCHCITCCLQYDMLHKANLKHISDDTRLLIAQTSVRNPQDPDLDFGEKPINLRGR